MADLDEAGIKVNEEHINVDSRLARHSPSIVGERGVGTRWYIDSDLHSEKKCNASRERGKEIRLNQMKLYMIVNYLEVLESKKKKCINCIPELMKQKEHTQASA